MTKSSTAPELQEYLRTKFALGAGGYSSQGVGRVSSGPSANDTVDPGNSYADNFNSLYGRNGSLNPMAYIRRKQDEYAKTLPARAQFRDTAQGPTNSEILKRDLIDQPTQTLSEYGTNARTLAGGAIEGFDPKNNSVTWYLDKISDPNVGLYKGTVDAFQRGGDNMQQFAKDVMAPEGGTQPTPNPTAEIKAAPKATSAKTEQTGMFPMSDVAAYGLGGAGAGALLGAATGRKGKRGRNALLGAGIGGGAGLLAQYLKSQNQPKTAAYNKTANGMLHDALGGGTGGAVLGGLYGAMTAPKKKLLRSALRGMIMGGGAGASFGLGTSAFGDPASASSNDPHAAEHAGYVRGLGAAAAGGMGGALSQRLADEYLPLEAEEDEKRSKKKLEKTALDPLGALKNVGTGALDATKNMYGKVHNMIPVTALEGAGLGGVGLATAAGTYGLINPGEYDTYDDKGNFAGKKRRSRFMGSMYYSTLGKILGTIGGGAVGHMYPGQIHALNEQLMNYGSGAYDSLRKAVGSGGKPQANPQAPALDYGMRLPNPTA
jgi:hypothetical protein